VDCLFVLLGSLHVKAARKMKTLVKLLPRRRRINNKIKIETQHHFFLPHLTVVKAF